MLQLLTLNPAYAILDETDSGLDVDALKTVAEGIGQLRDVDHAVLMITHYNRLLTHIIPDKVHIIINGIIVKTGTADLAHDIEHRGFMTYEHV